MTPDDFMSLDDARRQKSVPDKFSLNPATNPRALKIGEVRLEPRKDFDETVFFESNYWCCDCEYS